MILEKLIPGKELETDRKRLGWKFLTTSVFKRTTPTNTDYAVARLEIPKGTKLVETKEGNKMRVEEVRVRDLFSAELDLSVEDKRYEKVITTEGISVDYDEHVDEAFSPMAHKFKGGNCLRYEEGKVVKARNLCTDKSQECGAGINCFNTLALLDDYVTGAQNRIKKDLKKQLAHKITKSYKRKQWKKMRDKNKNKKYSLIQKNKIKF